jgi:hypothetical protein
MVKDDDDEELLKGKHVEDVICPPQTEIEDHMFKYLFKSVPEGIPVKKG